MWSAHIPKRAVYTAAFGATSAVGVPYAVRKTLESPHVCLDCSFADITVCKAKGVLEGNHFSEGLGEKIEESVDAIKRMKNTPPSAIDVVWRSGWRQRVSPLTGQTYYVRRGSFESPVASLLPSEAKDASMWEFRGSCPDDWEMKSHHGEDLLLPESTVWLGVPALDMIVDFFVKRVNAASPRVSKDSSTSSGQAILILPDFGGDFCKRTLPLAELVVADLPGTPVILLEMPLRGSRKPPQYRGAVLPAVQDMMHMGCAIIEESRSLCQWLRQRGFDGLTVSGISMGGHMATLTACCSNDVSRLCLLMPSHSAEANWTDGGVMGMNRSISADLLKPYLHEATHVETYPSCKAKLSILVAARDDGYVPLWSSMLLREFLEKARIPVDWRVIRGGHVEGFLGHQLDFARAVVDATLAE
eukprot:TRINITY_DN76232_c0_g1_i1.p1 TRINITY_DN76232_c0_g1~~TRINITY_DN76232_c0_g1_i1.p1  ORF type:complete len:416 (+),score=52.43 TRINITY_DN76232_c0_g1_i1:65-1312(+)